jgi:hypothetical protein
VALIGEFIEKSIFLIIQHLRHILYFKVGGAEVMSHI